MAVGIGTLTAAFSFVDAILLRPLPYPRPGELVVVQTRMVDGSLRSVSEPDYLDLREQSLLHERYALRAHGLCRHDAAEVSPSCCVRLAEIRGVSARAR